MAKFLLHIDRLQLRGIAPQQCDAFVAGLREELAWAFSQPSSRCARTGHRREGEHDLSVVSSPQLAKESLVVTDSVSGAVKWTIVLDALSRGFQIQTAGSEGRSASGTATIDVLSPAATGPIRTSIDPEGAANQADLLDSIKGTMVGGK